jgi:hypothetical protein
MDALKGNLATTLADIDMSLIFIDPLEELSDRDFDIWEPLLAIAAAAGGTWPGDAHDAAIALCTDGESQTVPHRILVLRDLHDIWNGEPFMFTEDEILPALHAIEERPWSDYYGSPLKSRRLAQWLSSYGIHSKPEPGESRRKGYYRQDIENAWARYTPTERVQTFQNLQEPDPETLETLETVAKGEG